MSSEQSIDPQLIEQTKQQIRGLVAEIAQLTKSEISPQEFYAEMLPRIISALAAAGGVVWTLEDQGRLALQYQMNLRESRLPEKDQDDQVRHGRLLQHVLRTGEGILVPPHSGSGDSEGGGNPTDFLLILGPLRTELEVVGVVEIFQRADSGASVQKGYLRFLLQICELAGDFLKSRQLRSFSDRQLLWTQLEEFTRLVHASLNPRDTAYTIANEGRRLIECDRVSVAIRKGDRCTIEAVSGQDVFDKRSNTIRLLGRLASVVVASGEPMWYTGDTSNMAPQVEDAVQEYVDESHTKMIAVLPLRRQELEEKERERPDDPIEAPEPVGALIVEQIEDARVAEKTRQRVDVVCLHSSAALANATEHESLFLMPVWRTLGKARWVVKARNLPKVVLGLVAAVAIVVALCTVPYEFALKSEGTLEPIDKRDVFTRVNGTVDEVLVDHNSDVTSGMVLARLRNYELQQRRIQVAGELAAAKEDRDSTQTSLVNSRVLPIEERNKLAGRLAELKEKIRSLETEHAILSKQIEDLEIRSPIDGKVTTFHLKRDLYLRPVREGQRLMQVADPSKEWELELFMPEEFMGHIAQAQNALYDRVRQRLLEVVRQRLREQVPDLSDKELNEAAEKQVGQLLPSEYRKTLRELTGEDIDDELEVTYVLATDPGRKYHGKAKEMHLCAEVHGEEKNAVRIKVAINRADLLPEQIRQGAEVMAKVECGRRPIGYVFLHKAFAWVKKMWFRWF